MTRESRKFRIALLLDRKGGARELSDAEVDSWSPGDGILWVDISQASKRGKEWLAYHANLDPNISSILLAGETRPRSLVDERGSLS
jgi:zinc transporter